MRHPDYNTLVPWTFHALACPNCRGKLELEEDHLSCEACGRCYPGLTQVVDFEPSTPDRDRWALPLRWAPLARRWRDQAEPWLRTPYPAGTIREEDWLLRWGRPVRGPVLDLQTGNGASARILARHHGVARVLAVDQRANRLKLAFQDGRDPGLAWIRAEPTRLPFQTAGVGAISVFSGLHQLQQVPETLAELARVAADGAPLLATAALLAPKPPAGWVTRLLGGRPVDAWIDLLNAADFQVLAFQPDGGSAFLAARRRAR